MFCHLCPLLFFSEHFLTACFLGYFVIICSLGYIVIVCPMGYFVPCIPAEIFNHCIPIKILLLLNAIWDILVLYAGWDTLSLLGSFAMIIFREDISSLTARYYDLQSYALWKILSLCFLWIFWHCIYTEIFVIVYLLGHLSF